MGPLKKAAYMFIIFWILYLLKRNLGKNPTRFNEISPAPSKRRLIRLSIR